jgi:hypothetical protein
MNHDEIIQGEQRKLQVSNKVASTIDSPGWQEVIQPMLDKMLEDVVGFKRGKKWVPGLLQKSEDANHMEYWVGYKQALIDFHNRTWHFVLRQKALEEKIKMLVERGSKPDKQPFAGSKYASEVKL